MEFAPIILSGAFGTGACAEEAQYRYKSILPIKCTHDPKERPPLSPPTTGGGLVDKSMNQL